MKIENIYHEFEKIIRKLYKDELLKKNVPLHRPIFNKKITENFSSLFKSNFVSTAGKATTEFEKKICQITQSKYCIATSSGTSALHVILHSLGASDKHEVITQSLTFIGTANAISYTGASPVFIDSNIKNFGMSDVDLDNFLSKNYLKTKNGVINKKTSKVLLACIPVHVFGVPASISKIKDICKKWGIYLIEDCAESLFSKKNGKHLGNFGIASAISFNGNKIITTGGGGAVVTNNKNLSKKIANLTTTCKKKHPHKFIHFDLGFNYRMPALNAQLGLSQLESSSEIIQNKRMVHNFYLNWAMNHNLEIHDVLDKSEFSNYWLNIVIFKNKYQKNQFINKCLSKGINVRSIWNLMHTLTFYKNNQRSEILNAKKIYDHSVCLPSSVSYLNLNSKNYL